MNEITNSKKPIFNDPKVAEIFFSYPQKIREKLLFLRALVFKTTKETSGAGTLEETLKWGEPAYITVNPKSETTIRINQTRANPEKYALFVNCRTNLINRYKQKFENQLIYDGSRGLMLHVDEKLPADKIKYCITLALIYFMNDIIPQGKPWIWSRSYGSRSAASRGV